MFPAEEASPEYRDYLQVNEIFYALLPEALDFTVGHDGFRSWLFRLADVRDNAEHVIEIARRLAWLVCENHLWPIPAAEAEGAPASRKLDRLVRSLARRRDARPGRAPPLRRRDSRYRRLTVARAVSRHRG